MRILHSTTPSQKESSSIHRKPCMCIVLLHEVCDDKNQVYHTFPGKQCIISLQVTAFLLTKLLVYDVDV